MQRFRHELAFLAGCISHRFLADMITDAGPSIYSGAAKSLGRVTPMNFVKTAAASMLFDLSAGLRKPVLGTMTSGGFSLQDLIEDVQTVTVSCQARTTASAPYSLFMAPVLLRVPRLGVCQECHPGMCFSFFPVADICPDRATSEPLEMSAKLARGSLIERLQRCW